MRENKGITLISLVITIILLLILAGISIAEIRGNGLFEKAKLAKEKAENAQGTENITLSNYEQEIDTELSGITRENSNSEWKYLGTITGKGSEIKLPSKFTELYVKSYCNDYYYTPAYIPKIILEDTDDTDLTYSMRLGYGNNGRQLMDVRYLKDSNSIGIGDCFDSNVSVNGKLVVYYR